MKRKKVLSSLKRDRLQKTLLFGLIIPGDYVENYERAIEPAELAAKISDIRLDYYYTGSNVFLEIISIFSLY